MRPVGTGEELKRRRHRALALLDEGLSLNEVARRCSCNASSVMRWRDAFRRGGKKALEAKATPGRPRRLSDGQRARLLQSLLKGPLANGYRTDLWTTQRIAELIQRMFKVKYHRDHIGRLLHAEGWSCQKPERRPVQRNDAAIEKWKKRDWVRVKKTPLGWAPTLPLSTNRASS